MLKDGGIYGVTTQTDKFYDRFIEIIQGHRNAPDGIIVAWNLSMVDTLKIYRPIVHQLINDQFEEVMTAIVPDVGFISETIRLRQEIKDQSSP